MDISTNTQRNSYMAITLGVLAFVVGFAQINSINSQQNKITTKLEIFSVEQIADMNIKQLKQIAADNKQIACITYALYGESRRKDQIKDTIGVANVIVNRSYHDRFPDTPCEVVTQRHQIEPLSPNKRLRKFVDNAIKGTVVVPSFIDHSMWIRLHKIASKVYLSQLPDPTYGATFFWSPSAQYALGRTPPKWSYVFPLVASLGNHKYHDMP